jgi:hypothetical protein
VIPLHLGSLHAIEVVLVAVLAVGPFLALAGAIVIARRRDRTELHSPESPESPVVTTHHQEQENSWC